MIKVKYPLAQVYIHMFIINEKTIHHGIALMILKLAIDSCNSSISGVILYISIILYN